MTPEVAAFCERIKVLGFRVYLSKHKDYGFITDDSESRVLSFSFRDGGSLGGNYGPPTTQCGTGWRMDGSPWDLKTADDVRKALYAFIPSWVGGPTARAAIKPSTVAQYRAAYQSSSCFAEA